MPNKRQKSGKKLVKERKGESEEGNPGTAFTRIFEQRLEPGQDGKKTVIRSG